jgi:glutamate carboxypeptidase
MVEMESPSDHKAAVDHLGGWLGGRFAQLGGRVQFHKAERFGNHLQVDFAGRKGKPILLLGHFDTVYALGTLAQMPC